MFTEQEFEIYAQRIVDLYEPINRHYLELMAQHIKDIGKLTPTDVHRLTQIQRMNKNAKEIASELAIATQKAETEIEAMFEEMAQDYYDFSEQYYDAQGLAQVPWRENKAMQQIVAAQVKTTQGTLMNLARTTASQLKKNPSDYRQLLDVAIRQANMGVTDYTSAIRSTVRTVAKRGIRCIDFDSGYKRRIDSQIRMNILDGARTQAINVAEQAGKEYGADGVEISAHGLCATDHLFIQGQQYAKKAWEKVNAGLTRAIGTLNCKHFAFPILLGISEPAHTKEELDAINKTSTATTTIDGKTKTGYEWTQEQRKLETKIREQKDIAVAAAAEGDMTLRREAQAKMNAYRAEYDDISEKANLIQKPERMTVSRFHRVKAENQLKSAQSGGIIQERAMANGMRQNRNRVLNELEIKSLKEDAKSLGIPENILKFNRGKRTGFIDNLETIAIRGDILPDLESSFARDKMSQKAVLAHEYYGHYKNHPSEYEPDDWRDEFRASYDAAKNAPNLADEDRAYLMIDAYDRAKEAGEFLEYDEIARRIIYGY